MNKRTSISAGASGGLSAVLILAACMAEPTSDFKETSPRDLAVVDGILKKNGIDAKIVELGCSFCLTDHTTGRIRRIDLGGYRLDSLPSGLETLAGLEELILDESVVGGFPESLCGAVSLRKLSWKKGEMRSLPACIGNLSRLEYLNLSGNVIMDLPDSFGNLDSLVTLDLGVTSPGSWLRSFPDVLPSAYFGLKTCFSTGPCPPW